VQSGIRPLKRFSQNLLKDPVFARKLAESLDIRSGDAVLEIGPGEGILTRFFLESPAEKVIAVEIDRRFAAWLRKRFAKEKKFRLVEGNFLMTNLQTLVPEGSKLRIVGNIPYAITSPILFHLLDNRAFIRDFGLTVQKEVCRRVVSPPGSKIYGIPSVLFQLHADVRMLFTIPPGAFLPVPKVDSAVLYGRFCDKPKFEVADEKFFRTFVKTLFGQRRKMIRNTIQTWAAKDEDLGVFSSFLDKRPEMLSVGELVALSNHILSRQSEG
jgi:16S rRNA (adenine1518-N6/adenine1519-N6)-dimethyltransferase